MSEIDDRERETAEVVLRAEQAEIGVRRRPYKRLRVRKVIVTEEVTMTVQVRHEELLLEEYDVGPADADDTSSPPTGTDTLEIVLHREEPAVQMAVRPVERVRIGKRRAERTQDVDIELREEYAEVDRIP